MECISGSSIRILMVAAAIATTLSACDKLPGLSEDPAKSCTSPETVQTVQQLVVADLASDNDPVIKQVAAKSVLRIDLPALDSYDKITKKITCSGSVVAKWYLPYQTSVNAGKDSFSSEDTRRGQYTIQPQAGGGQVIYSVDGDIAKLKGDALLYVVADLQARKNAMQASAPGPATAAPTQPEPAPDGTATGTAQTPGQAPPAMNSAPSPTAGKPGDPGVSDSPSP